DHFYYNGISSSDNERWNREFVNMFKPNCAWWALLGNHDFHTQYGEAQLLYGLTSPHWVMPGYYYEILTDRGDWVLQTLMLDTIHIAPYHSSQMFHSFPKLTADVYKNSHIIRRDQKRWINDRLHRDVYNGKKVQWRFVCGHYPMYSHGNHGDTQEVIDFLKPFLSRIDMYICGHDHHTEVRHVDGMISLLHGTGSFFAPPSFEKNDKDTWIASSPIIPVLTVSKHRVTIHCVDIEDKSVKHMTYKTKP
ncbi:MAG: hypothetical protein EBV19_09585, partial [Flavobacteriia bacterium]|nr:hypothetical protein [Flavobacteriia bacterium]